MVRVHLAYPARGLLVVLALAAGLGVVEARPARALNVMLTVAEHKDDPGDFRGDPTMAARPRELLDFIATTDEDVNPQFRILIYDENGVFELGQCGPGDPGWPRRCKVPTTRQVPIWGNSFIAFVAPPPASAMPRRTDEEIRAAALARSPSCNNRCSALTHATQASLKGRAIISGSP